MMPVPLGYSSVWVHVDDNAAIDYTRERALHKLGMPPTDRRQDALRIHLERMPHVYVAETAGEEAQRNMRKDILEKVDPDKIHMVTGLAQTLVKKYCNESKCDDYLGYVDAAREMYAAISGDPGNRKFSKWRKKKRLFVDNPVLGSRNDLRILSTAAHHARQHEVELWTHDRDFTMFADEIWKTFAVKVVDSHCIGE